MNEQPETKHCALTGPKTMAGNSVPSSLNLPFFPDKILFSGEWVYIILTLRIVWSVTTFDFRSTHFWTKRLCFVSWNVAFLTDFVKDIPSKVDLFGTIKFMFKVVISTMSFLFRKVLFYCWDYELYIVDTHSCHSHEDPPFGDMEIGWSRKKDYRQPSYMWSSSQKLLPVSW